MELTIGATAGAATAGSEYAEAVNGAWYANGALYANVLAANGAANAVATG